MFMYYAEAEKEVEEGEDGTEGSDFCVLTFYNQFFVVVCYKCSSGYVILLLGFITSVYLN